MVYPEKYKPVGNLYSNIFTVYHNLVLFPAHKCGQGTVNIVG